MNLIQCAGISKLYGKRQSEIWALKDISLSIKEGSWTAIMGKSGCGKSTLLNILAGLTRPTKGTYFFDGKDISSAHSGSLATFRNQNIGFIVQRFALIQDITVYKNIALPMKYQNNSEKQIKKRIMELAEMLELNDRLTDYPSELSGGQQQRVAIARAISTRPRLLLADEPTGSLDEENGRIIMNLLRELHREGHTIILVTHAEDIAQQSIDLLLMRDGMIESSREKNVPIE